MKRQLFLFGLFVGLPLLLALSTAGLALAHSTGVTQSNGVTDLGPLATPDGYSEHNYSVSMPDGYSAVLATQQPDGTFKIRYFKTIAEYDAAVAAMGGSSGSPTTTVTTGSAPSLAPAPLP